MRWRIIAMVAVAAVLLFLVGYRVTRDLLTDGTTVAPTASETSPPGKPARRQCTAVATTDATSQPLDPFWLDQVRAVHDAACRRDYDELARLMDDPFQHKSPADVVNGWRTVDPDGVRLDILSAILETRGTLDQGGLVFCQEDGVVAFARGTVDRPGKWSEFAIFAFPEGTELTPNPVGCV